jgi:hypothetical protein
MSLTPWWSRACCGVLGTRGTIVSYVPDPVGENQFIVTFEYTDWRCNVTLLPAQILMPAGPMQQLDNCRWRVFGVPLDSFIQVLMRATNGSVAVITMHFAPRTCQHVGRIVNLEPEYERSGAECLAFKWDTVGGFPYGYVYLLYRVAAQAEVLVSEGRLARGATSVVLNLADTDVDMDGVDPAGQLYRIELRGACNFDGSQTSEPASVVAITAPAPALGFDFTIDSAEIVEDEGRVVFTIVYSDYYCVNADLINITTDAPGVAVTHVGGDTWLVGAAPFESTVDLVVSATVDTISCACTTSSTLQALLQLVVPAAPSADCSTLSVTGLAAAVSGQCLTFQWNRIEQCRSYNWVLYKDTDIFGLGNLLQPVAPAKPSVTITSLPEQVEFSFNVTGVCLDGSETDEFVLLNISTSPVTAPSLPDFGSNSSDKITFTNQGAGLVNVQIVYTDWECVATPTLNLLNPIQPSTASYIGNNTWQVHNLPMNTTFTADFSATELSDCGCGGSGSVVLTTAPFTFTTPSSCLPLTQSQLTFQAPGPTCLTAGWSYTAGAYASVSYTIKDAAGTKIASGSMIASTSTLFTVTAEVEPHTVYTFTVTPTCITGGIAAPTTVTCTTPESQTPGLGPIPLSSGDWTVVVSPGGEDTYTLALSYPVASAVCIDDSTLRLALFSYTQPDPPPGPITGPITNNTNYVWTIPGFQPGALAVLELSGDASTTVCGCGAGAADSDGTFTVSIGVTAPSSPTPPPPATAAAPYELSILNYAGPPPFFNSFMLEGNIDVINGAGDQWTIGSYYNQWMLHDMYARQIVDYFITYNAQQRLFTCNVQPYGRQGDVGALNPITYHLPIAAVYYGIAGDPTNQGLSTPVGTSTDQKAKRTYAFCDSSAPLVNPHNALLCFQYPPMITFFIRLLTYNWNVATQCPGYTANARQVKFALTLYGSKERNEQWFFETEINSSTGEITTKTPSNPKSMPSVVNNFPNDGNFATGDLQAGWNCMERWFMYVGYVNQQLRRIIAAGVIVNSATPVLTMTLDSIIDDTLPPALNKVYASCCQISAITTDQEGNGFDNANYTPPPPGTPQYFSKAVSNAAMKALWNKWVNQDTTPTPLPSDWPGDWNTDFNAPQPRILMPGETFTLPCAMSMTTAGLLPQMGNNDLGTADCDAINAVFNEIYDTSDITPFCYLGAVSGGVSFTETMHTVAIPTVSTATYACDPMSYATAYGMWDNLVGGKLVGLLPAKCATGNLQIPCPVADNPSYTAFTNSSRPWTPLMQTSQCNPWVSGTTSKGWNLAFGGSGGTCDSNSLAWALESSRYDMYNGMWAAKVRTPPSDINYNNVVQNAQGSVEDVDGALIWADMSTGLKPRVAARIAGLSKAAAVRMNWMLSTQSGPFVNNCGVRFSARPVPPTAPPPHNIGADDYLTFTYPHTVSGGDNWPGWYGMKGQWYGPGTKANAGTVVTWALDQFFTGKKIGFTPNQGNIIAPVTPTGSSEDNFGVFADFAIIEAAWARMALDLRGLTQGTDGNPICRRGVTNAQLFTYLEPDPVSAGLYELAYIPLSWFNPVQTTYVLNPPVITPSPP